MEDVAGYAYGHGYSMREKGQREPFTIEGEKSDPNSPKKMVQSKPVRGSVLFP